MTFTAEPTHLEPARDLMRSMKRGALGRCPHCGEGKLFRAYLKVTDTCPVCGEELFHQRADDAPPYVTIFIVGHVVVGGLLLAEDYIPDLPVALHVVVWTIVTIAMSLTLLPIVKGALIGLQWALRMHGFDHPEVDADEAGSRLGGNSLRSLTAPC